MIVRYTNTYLDALAFATMQNLRSVSLLLFVVTAAGFVTWSNLPAEATGFAGAVTFVVATLAFFVVLMAFQLLFNAYWFAANRDRNFLTAHTAELSETSLVVSTLHTRHEIRWAGVYAVRRHFNRLFVLNGPTQAHCIPARAFASRSDFDTFSNQAREYQRRAASTPDA